jgi:CRISPR-associated protein Csb2
VSLLRTADELEHPNGQIVRYVFDAQQPPLPAIVPVADAFRTAVLSALRGAHSFLLSGRCADGSPDLEHRHAYYLPQPDDSGRLVGLLVVSPRDRFNEQELCALRAATTLRWNGQRARLRVQMIDADDGTCATVATRWTSVTPYVPMRRFWGTSGKHHLTPERQLASELRRLKRVPVDVTIHAWCDVRVRVPSAAKRAGGFVVTRRKSFRVTFRADQPILAPIALGHSCHFGLGQFVPMLV